jgi:hypothetical protein
MNCLRNHKNIILLGLILLGLSSCSEEFDFEFEEQEALLVVEGCITNQAGPYYVRLTQSLSEVVKPDYSFSFSSPEKPVTDAVVRISDDIGNSESLRYIGKREGMYPENEGWYVVENLQGVVGRTYTLAIEWKGEIYTARDRMEAVPEIEKIDFRTKHLEAKNEDVDIPLIYFHEPQGVKNYYLMYYSTNGFFGSNRNWAFSVLSDEFLEPYVNGLEVDDGQSPSGSDFYQTISPGSEVVVYLESLSQPAYEFYSGVINQFDADGGAFSPAPASPPGNISNGAMGLFHASAVSVKRKKR